MADKPDFAKVREQCEQWVQLHAQRDAMYKAIERMVQMDWDYAPTEEYIKPTMSPDPHNAIIGIVRLMTSTEPQISVGSCPNDQASIDTADKLEKVLKALWYKANAEQQWPLHYGACYSAALYSEVCIQIGSMADNVAWSAAKGQTAERLQEEARQRPFVYSVKNPTQVYPQFGAFGLRSVLHRYVRRLWEVKEWWGSNAKHVDGEDLDLVTYNDYWTEEHRIVWVSSHDKPILYERHGLPFIPWVCRVVMGSGLYAEPEKQRVPMLLPLHKGKWWHRQNLLYTAFFTLASQMGWPTWIVKTNDGRDIAIDLNRPGGQIPLRLGESVEPLQKMLIDAAVTQGLQIADQKTVASTLPRIVFGESPGSTMAYSAMNLLSQGGRLPLVPIEQQVGRALAEMFEVTLKWIAHRGEPVELYRVGELASIEPADINTAHIEIDVKLKADIPQDRLQLANVVNLLRQPGPDGLPLISRMSAVDLLGYMQPGDEFDQIVTEAIEAKLVSAELDKTDQARQGMVPPAGMQQPEPPQGLPPVQQFGTPEPAPMMTPEQQMQAVEY